MSAMSDGLCRRCSRYSYVELHELGRVAERCVVWPTARTFPSRVTQCTGFSAADEPWIFEKDAWVGRKDSKGVVHFHDPNRDCPHDCCAKIQLED